MERQAERRALCCDQRTSVGHLMGVEICASGHQDNDCPISILTTSTTRRKVVCSGATAWC